MTPAEKVTSRMQLVLAFISLLGVFCTANWFIMGLRIDPIMVELKNLSAKVDILTTWRYDTDKTLGDHSTRITVLEKVDYPKYRSMGKQTKATSVDASADTIRTVRR